MRISILFPKLASSVSMLIGVGLLAGVTKTGVITLSKIMSRKFGNSKKQRTFPLDMIIKIFHISGMSKEKNAFLALTKYWVYGAGLGLFRWLVPLIGHKKIAVFSIRAIVIQLISTIMIPFIKKPAKNKFNVRTLSLQLTHHLLSIIAAGLAANSTMNGKAYR